MNYKMKRILSILSVLTVAVALTVILISCGGNGGNEDQTSAQIQETSGVETSADTDEITTVDDITGEVTTEETTEEATECLELTDGYINLVAPSAIKSGKHPNQMSAALNEDGATFVKLTSKGSDPYTYCAYDSIFAVGRYMKIKYRTNADTAGGIFLGVSGVDAIGSQSFEYKADGEWHIATVDLFDNKAYSGNYVNYFRLDFADTKGAEVDVEWMAFYPDDGAPHTDNLSFPDFPADAPNLSLYERLGQNEVYIIPSGFDSRNASVFTFTKGFETDIYYRANFNRFTLNYSSTQPIKGEITYLCHDGDSSIIKSEEFFLEAGEDMSFSQIIDGYFKNEYAYGISQIKLDTCNGKETDFTLDGISSDIVHVYGSGTLYLDSEKYILGVLLEWGGGISYIEDKTDGIEKVTNLINRADQGRLIQQSYYGTGDCEGYTCATYNGQKWTYNPVQGGDQHRNSSKIVDIRVSDDKKSVYIKCRPLDWAQNNLPCPAYMENTYTISDDSITVDNRFTDFFGVKHPGGSHQELPAFYTISYLGIFSYYNGTKPWTGDDYEVLPNEEFWAGRSSAYHKIVSGNTETWGAWTSKDGWGIGLYVPGTEQMLAGRFSYNGSKSAGNTATNYVAPLRTMGIVSFQPFEYSYVIATGTIDQMRQVFRDYYENNK